jgi:ABC-type glycerol-3-phosphate transport system substrate-binding protein
MKKYSIFAGVLIILIIIFLIQASWEKDSKKNVEISSIHRINMYHYYTGALDGGIDEMISKVNQQQSEYQVEAHGLDHEAFKSMIHSTLSKGNPPELFTYWAGARVQTLVDRNQLEPIDDLWLKMNFDNRFSKALINSAVTYDGKRYLLPISQFITVFFYNKSIFLEAGLKPPKNWNEFLTICSKLNDLGINPIALGAKERWPAQFWLDYLLLRTAGHEYREKLMKGIVSYTDPEVVRVYKLWSQLLIKGYFNKDANQLDWADATERVCHKKAAMTLMGTWALQHLTGDKCDLKAGIDFDYFVFPEIDKDIPKVAVGPVDGIVLTRNSANPLYAKTVLATFAGDIPQQMLSEGSGSFAPSLRVPHSFYTKFKQKIIKEVEKTPFWAFNYDLATPPPIAEFGMNSFNELIEYPDQYESILENVQLQAEKIFKSSDIYSIN